MGGRLYWEWLMSEVLRVPVPTRGGIGTMDQSRSFASSVRRHAHAPEDSALLSTILPGLHPPWTSGTRGCTLPLHTLPTSLQSGMSPSLNPLLNAKKCVDDALTGAGVCTG